MIKLDDVTAKFENEAGFSGCVAISDFLESNNFSLEDISVTVIEKNRKLIIRVPSWNVKKNRDAEKTIYHGTNFDIFEWVCMTSKSGMLAYNDDMSYDYKLHCSE